MPTYAVLTPQPLRRMVDVTPRSTRSSVVSVSLAPAVRAKESTRRSDARRSEVEPSARAASESAAPLPVRIRVGMPSRSAIAAVASSSAPISMRTIRRLRARESAGASSPLRTSVTGTGAAYVRLSAATAVRPAWTASPVGSASRTTSMPETSGVKKVPTEVGTLGWPAKPSTRSRTATLAGVVAASHVEPAGARYCTPRAIPPARTSAGLTGTVTVWLSRTGARRTTRSSIEMATAPRSVPVTVTLMRSHLGVTPAATGNRTLLATVPPAVTVPGTGTSSACAGDGTNSSAVNAVSSAPVRRRDTRIVTALLRASPRTHRKARFPRARPSSGCCESRECADGDGRQEQNPPEGARPGWPPGRVRA